MSLDIIFKFISVIVALFIIKGNCKLVDVLQFQKDGIPRKDTMATYKGNLSMEHKLYSLTFCFRFNLYFFHASATVVKLEDTTANNDEMLVGIIWVDRLRTMLSGVRKFQDLQVEFQVNRWYHLCFVYDDTNEQIASYIDGQVNNIEAYKMQEPCFGDQLTVGQGIKDLVDETSFSGQLTQLNIWDRPLSAREIKDLAACLVDLQGNYISWEYGWNKYNIETVSLDLQEICDTKEHSKKYFWFPDMSQENAYYICNALGGYLPEVGGLNETDFWHSLTLKKWPGTVECMSSFWTPLTDEAEEGIWVRGYDPESKGKVFWETGQPDGKRHENCAVIYRDGMRDVNCPATFQCAICQIQLSVVYTIRGTCETDKRHSYFYLYQEKMGTMEFRGFAGYIIEKINGTWIMKERRDGPVMAQLNKGSSSPDYPMGRRRWNIYSKMCGQTEGTKMLLLSPCKPGDYTCDDGFCISIENRCDLKYDCLDHSDEFNCELINVPEGYQNNLPPRISDYNSRSLPVSTNLTIESVTVETMTMTMSVSFVMEMTWRDYRLQYTNLKNKTSLNRLPLQIMKQIWAPSVSFVNTMTGDTTLIDADSQLVIQRESNITRRDLLSPIEVEYYDGSSNPLAVTRKYAIDFSCDFDLVLYPFDNQYCDMKLQVTSASRDYVKFELNTSDVTYLGSAFLLEYQMGEPLMATLDGGEFSEIFIRIPLKRLYGFAGLNIYSPSFILLVISYSSLFFRPYIFEVRVMSVLTVLLVTATLFAQVAASLPKTSYFKIVDVWLFFCIFMNFIIIIFHAFIDLQMHDEVEKNVSSARTKRAFEMLGNKIHPTDENKTKKQNIFMAIMSKFYSHVSLKSTIIFSRIFVLLVFAVFCLSYWGYVLL